MAKHRAPNKPGAQLLRRVTACTALAALAVGAFLASPALAALTSGPTVACDPSPVDEHGTFTLTCRIDGWPTPPPTTTTPPPATTPPAPTTTPPPETTTAPTTRPKLTNCFTQLAACGYPTRDTTGVPAGTLLRPAKGMTIRTDGTILDGLDITGCVAVEATNVVIRNSRITGRCYYGVDMRSGSLTIEDSEINCVTGEGTGIAWDHFTARRVYIHDCENALEMGEGSSVVDSYLGAREGAPTSHGDMIQSQGGDHVTIRHNTFAGLNPITSSIITNPARNHHWLVEDNFLSAGAYTLYCPEQGEDFVVRDNRFYPARTGDPHSAAYGLTDACGHDGIVWSGNYRDDTLAAVRP